jgi:hypothetical protein
MGCDGNTSETTNALGMLLKWSAIGLKAEIRTPRSGQRPLDRQPSVLRLNYRG